MQHFKPIQDAQDTVRDPWSQQERSGPGLKSYPKDHPKISCKAEEMYKSSNIGRQIASAPSRESYSSTHSSKPDLHGSLCSDIWW